MGGGGQKPRPGPAVHTHAPPEYGSSANRIKNSRKPLCNKRHIPYNQSMYILRLLIFGASIAGGVYLSEECNEPRGGAAVIILGIIICALI